MKEKEKLKKVELTLSKYGYQKLKFEKINYGVNSSSWKVLSKNKNFFLKLYQSKNNDTRDRLGNELRFIHLLKEGGIENIPIIFLKNRKDNWILFEWIEGVKINNPSYQNYEEMITFFKKIQTLKLLKKVETIGNASEACFNLFEHKKLILNRIEETINAFSGQIHTWLIDEVLVSVNICCKKYNDYFLANEKSSLVKKEKILSPSDVGFHNILKINNKLYFYDFEYAGWDDPYKLTVDIIIQPENILNKELSLKILNSLKTEFPIDNKFIYLKIYLILYRAKWVCIILKRIIHSECERKDQELIIKKTINYFNHVGEIWDL